MLSEVKNKLKILIFIGILFLIFPFLNFTTTIDPETLPRCVGLAALLLFYLVYYFIDILRSSKSLFFFLKNPIVITFLLYAVIATLSLVMTLNIGDGILEVLKIFLYLALLLVFTQLLLDHKYCLAIAIKCINLSVIIFSFFGLLQLYSGISQLTDLNIKLAIDYRIHSTLATKNIYSEVLFLCLPFSVYGFIIFRSFWKCISFINMFVILLSLIVLMNLYVWLALIICGSAFVSLLFFRNGKKLFLINKRKGLFFFFAISLSVLLIGRSAFSKLSTLEKVRTKLEYVLNYVKHSDQIDEYSIRKNDNNIHERIVLVKNTSQMIKDHFFTGVGISNWKILEPIYGQVSLTDSIRIDYPHNDFLSVFSEMGVVGFLFYVLFFLFSLKQTLQLFLKSEVREEKWLGLLLFCGILGFAIISFFGFAKEKAVPMILLMTMVSICISKHSVEIRVPSLFFKKTLIIFLAFTCTFFIYAGTKRINSEIHLLKALKAKKFQLWPNVIREVDKAYSIFHPVDFSSTPLDWYKGSAFYYSGNLDSGVFYFQRALTFNPHHPYVLNDLATCYEKNNNHKQAIQYYEMAYKLNPKLVHNNLIAAYYNNGEIDKAYELSSSNRFDETPYLADILNAKALMICELQNDDTLRSFITNKMKQDGWLMAVFSSAKTSKLPFETELINSAKKGKTH